MSMTVRSNAVPATKEPPPRNRRISLFNPSTRPSASSSIAAKYPSPQQSSTNSTRKVSSPKNNAKLIAQSSSDGRLRRQSSLSCLGRPAQSKPAAIINRRETISPLQNSGINRSGVVRRLVDEFGVVQQCDKASASQSLQRRSSLSRGPILRSTATAATIDGRSKTNTSSPLTKEARQADTSSTPTRVIRTRASNSHMRTASTFSNIPVSIAQLAKSSGSPRRSPLSASISGKENMASDTPAQDLLSNSKGSKVETLARIRRISLIQPPSKALQLKPRMSTTTTVPSHLKSAVPLSISSKIIGDKQDAVKQIGGAEIVAFPKKDESPTAWSQWQSNIKSKTDSKMGNDANFDTGLLDTSFAIQNMNGHVTDEIEAEIDRLRFDQNRSSQVPSDQMSQNKMIAQQEEELRCVTLQRDEAVKQLEVITKRLIEAQLTASKLEVEVATQREDLKSKEIGRMFVEIGIDSSATFEKLEKKENNKVRQEIGIQACNNDVKIQSPEAEIIPVNGSQGHEAGNFTKKGNGSDAFETRLEAQEAMWDRWRCVSQATSSQMETLEMQLAICQLFNSQLDLYKQSILEQMM